MKYIFLFVFFFVPVCLSAETLLPVLTTDTSLATAGYFQLSWQPGVAGVSNKNLLFELQQSPDKSFQPSKTIYRGSDLASVISGQPDGGYFYRVRMIYADHKFGNWSNSIVVKVQHHSLQKAWLFFTAGACVFLITLLFIIISSRSGDKV